MLKQMDFFASQNLKKMKDDMDATGISRLRDGSLHFAPVQQ